MRKTVGRGRPPPGLRRGLVPATEHTLTGIYLSASNRPQWWAGPQALAQCLGPALEGKDHEQCSLLTSCDQGAWVH